MATADRTTDEPVGTTPASLFSSLWAGEECDTYVSRAMGLRQFPTGKGFGDAVWVHEPPGDAVCYFRVTPARLVGLIVRLKKREAALAETRTHDAPLADGLAARAGELARVVARDTEVLRLLKEEFKARWPEAVKRLGEVIPEDIEDPARPSDAWLVTRETRTRPVPVAPPLDGPDADLVAWARSAPAPVGAFRPTPYSVVLDGPTWLARLVARAGGDAAPARATALSRLRALRADPPPPATRAEEATARELAARP